MKTWIMADPHLGEGENVLNRPFANAKEMSAEIVENVNSRADKRDRVIIVGDFAFKNPGKWRGKFRCKNMILVMGNHDKHAQSKAAFGDMNVRDQYDTKILGHPTFFSHYPAMYWPKSYYGSMHGFGHVHDQRTETIELVFPNARMMDVGVDAAQRLLGKYTCFSDQEFYDLLIQKPGHDPVEWYRERRGEYKKDHVTEYMDEVKRVTGREDQYGGESV